MKMHSPTARAGTSELVTEGSLYSPWDVLETSGVALMNHSLKTPFSFQGEQEELRMINSDINTYIASV